MKLYLFIRIIIIYGCECFRDRLRLSVSRPIEPSHRVRLPPFQHLSICRYFTTLWDIIYIIMYVFFVRENSVYVVRCFLPISLPMYSSYISLWSQDSSLGKSGWKIPILIAGQREFHVRVPQDRLPALHIYVRNIVDTSSSLCCATWRTTCWPTRCLPLFQLHAAAAEILKLWIPCKQVLNMGCKVFGIMEELN